MLSCICAGLLAAFAVGVNGVTQLISNEAENGEIAFPAQVDSYVFSTDFNGASVNQYPFLQILVRWEFLDTIGDFNVTVTGPGDVSGDNVTFPLSSTGEPNALFGQIHPIYPASVGQYLVDIGSNVGNTTYMLVANMICPLDFTLNQSTGTTCVPCPEFASSFGYSFSTSACRCKPNFLQTVADNGAIKCSVCPTGAVCDDYGTTDPVAQPGYVTFGGQIIQCPRSDSCLGGPDNACADSYEGLICGSCSDDHFMISQECKDCTNSRAVLWISIAILIAIWCISFMWAKICGRFGEIPLVIRYLQLVSLFAFIDIGWPVVIDDTFSTLSLFRLNIEISQLECLLEGDTFYYVAFAIVLLLPIIWGAFYLLLLWAIWILRSFARHTGWSALRGAANAEMMPWVRSSANAGIILYEVLFVPLCVMLFQTVRCETITDLNREFLVVFPAIDCRTTGYKVIEALAYVFMVVYLLTPMVVYTYYVYRYRRLLKDDKKLYSIAGSLYGRYMIKFVYWPVVECITVIIFVNLALHLQDEPSSQLISAVAVLIAYLVGVLIFDPYLHVPVKITAIASVSALILLIIYGNVTATSNTRPGFETISLILIVSAPVVGGACVVYEIWKEYTNDTLGMSSFDKYRIGLGFKKAHFRDDNQEVLQSRRREEANTRAEEERAMYLFEQKRKAEKDRTRHDFLTGTLIHDSH
eukprot:Clim_evm21s11 gene=Clim_evmTU21s11